MKKIIWKTVSTMLVLAMLFIPIVQPIAVHAQTASKEAVKGAPTQTNLALDKPAFASGNEVDALKPIV